MVLARLAGFPVLGQRRFEPLARDPEELMVPVGVHTQALCILENLVLRRLVVVGNLREHHTLRRLCRAIDLIFALEYHVRPARVAFAAPTSCALLMRYDTFQMKFQNVLVRLLSQ